MDRSYCDTNLLSVQEATAPEDYLYENICVNRLTRFLSQLGVRFVVLLVLVACALAVTKLMSTNYRVTYTIAWKVGAQKQWHGKHASTRADRFCHGHVLMCRIRTYARPSRAQ